MTLAIHRVYSPAFHFLSHHLFQLGLTTIYLLGFPAAGLTQIVPDASLGAERSILTPNVDNNGQRINRIDGGATRGSNLFHSFRDFNVNTGTNVYFANPAGVDNIFTRITGTNPSTINGTLGVLGSSNLFLLNPNGIVFGANAQLDIQGSLFAGSASGVNFADGSVFSAQASTTSPILTVSVPAGLQYGPNVGILRLQGANLQAAPGQILSLGGKDMILNGGSLTALDGKVELTANPGNLSVTGTAINTSGLSGGSIQIQGNQVTFNRSQILANTIGAGTGQGITINAGQFRDTGSLISTSTFGPGAGGSLNIQADTVELNGTGTFNVVPQLLTGTFNPQNITEGIYVLSGGSGDAGNFNINARTLKMGNAFAALTPALGTGAGGDVNFNVTDSIEILKSTLVLSGTLGIGDAGNVTVNTRTLTMRDGAAISTTPSAQAQGLGGNLTVTATEFIETIDVPDGAAVPGGLFTTTLGTGSAGDLTVTTGRLTVRNGTQVSAAASGGGRSGNLTVNADEIELRGISADGRWLSGLFTSSSLLVVVGRPGAASAGNLTVNTRTLTVANGAQVSAATGGEGAAGTLTVNASDSIRISGFGITFNSGLEGIGVDTPDGKVVSAISAFTTGVGEAGDLILNTEKLTVDSDAQIQVNGTGIGNAGNIQINAPSILLNQGNINAATASGEGGNITFQSSQVQLRHNSEISTEARGNGNGGNITLNTDTLTQLENSDINANAFEGRGGNIEITTQGIFLSPESEITASSERGISGVVDIKTPDTQLQNTLTPLSAEFVSPEQVVADSCLARRNQQRGSFTVTGTGGVPQTPYDAITGRYQVTEVQGLSISQGRISPTSPPPISSQRWKVGDPIIEAQGIVMGAGGQTLLGAVPGASLSNVKNEVCTDQKSDE
jgi:filamentous hemagglutinin family protein